jgi:hypothetical protein
MISLQEFKKSLGKTAEKMTDEQLLRLREIQDKEAEIYFSMWLKKIQQNKQIAV